MAKPKPLKPTSPSTAVALAASKAKGKRSGVVFPIVTRPNSKNSTEDMEKYFKYAQNNRSPEPDKAAGEKFAGRKNGVSEQQKCDKVPGKPNKPNFNFQGAESNKESEAVKASNAITKPVKSKGKSVSTSPSELSMVSTAPPTPASVSESPFAQNDSPIVTQENGEPSNTTTEVVESRQEVKEPSRGAPSELVSGSPEDHFGGDHDDDDELVPPPPPFPEEPQDAHDRSQDSNAGFHTEFDDHDDDDKEGEGFQMTDQLEHPEEASLSKSQDDVGLPSEIESEEHDHKKDYLYDAKGSSPEEKKHSVTRAVSETPKAASSVASEAFSSEGGRNANKLVDSDDGGVDKEGEPFNIVHDPETPESVRDERIQQEEKEMEKKRKPDTKQKRKARFKGDGNDEMTSNETPAKSTRSRKTKKRVRLVDSPAGYPAGPRDYSAVPVSDYKESPEEGVRRSRRARYKPLAFWKNERPIYGANDEEGILGEAMGNMPVVKSVLHALPTPYKKRKLDLTAKDGKRSQGKASRGKSVDPAETPFDAKKLKKKFEYIEGEEAAMWNEGAQSAEEQKVVSFSKNLTRHDLPLDPARKKSEGNVVGRAAQAFNISHDEDNENYVGYIMGHLALPPKGIKDAESVGNCAQTFTVCHCQPNALEVSYADPEASEGAWEAETAQRFLLGPGDMFRIPQGNCYRLQNHSSSADCLLTWTIIRPHAP